MTNEEAIRTIKYAKAECEWICPMEYQEAFDKAIEALKKQILTKPNIEEWENRVPSERKVFICPSCGYFIGNLNEYTYEPRAFCPACGQALEWGGI